MYIPDVDDCEGIVCHNGGSCEDGLDSFACLCYEGFEGALCQAGSSSLSYSYLT